jgi:hypothetical protein
MISGPMTQRFAQQENKPAPSQVTVCLFQKYMNGQATFDTARNTIRLELHSQSLAQFSGGTRHCGQWLMILT